MATSIEQPGLGQDGPNPHRNSDNGAENYPGEYMAVILQSLQTMKDGDFTARLPVAWTGLAGKIADNFNEIVTANEQMAQRAEARGPGGRQRGQDAGTDPCGAAARRVGRHGSER